MVLVPLVLLVLPLLVPFAGATMLLVVLLLPLLLLLLLLPPLLPLPRLQLS